MAQVNESSGSEVSGLLGTLCLSVVRPGASTMALRALRWHRDLDRLGARLPFHVVHDIGLLFAAPREQLAFGPRQDLSKSLQRLPGGHDLALSYEQLVVELSRCEAARRAQSFRLSDDMIVVVLSRVLSGVSDRVSAQPAYGVSMVADAAAFERAEQHLEELFAAVDRSFELQSMVALRALRLRILTVADALDLDTLRLLGVLGAEGVGASIQVDLLAAMTDPSANDVVNFSLEILPSVLESKHRAGLTHRAGDGYGGIGSRGDVDHMVLTELAWDAEDFVRRVLENEVLFYVKETVPERASRRHVLLVDASASMRGERQMFARGMALATAKKIVLEGEDVSIRFFDSRLYDPLRAVNGSLPTAQVLSFQGERGRNPARVFAELVTALDLEMNRDRREVVIHAFTHAALYIPRELVVSVRQRACLAVVFILPSGGKLQLDYLDLLDTHWVVDHATLGQREARANRARDILGQIGTRSVGVSADQAAPRSRA